MPHTRPPGEHDYEQTPSCPGELHPMPSPRLNLSQIRHSNCVYICVFVCVEYNSRHRKHSRWRSAHLRVRLQLTAISSHSHSHSQSAIATATATATATVTATAVATAIILVAGRCKCNHAPVIYCRALVKRYAGLRQSATTM